MILKTHALYWREQNVFLNIGLPITRKPKKSQFVFFSAVPPRMTAPAAKMEWAGYERARLFHGHDIPPLELVVAKGHRANKNAPVLFSVETLDLTAENYYTVWYGATFAENAAKARASQFDLKYAIARTGRTQKNIKEAIPTGYHSGIYSFFDNEEDYVLAKLMLGGTNISKTYDEIIALPENIKNMAPRVRPRRVNSRKK